MTTVESKDWGEWESWIYKLVPVRCPRLRANDKPTEGPQGSDLVRQNWPEPHFAKCLLKNSVSAKVR